MDRILGIRAVPWSPDGSDYRFDIQAGMERPAEVVPRTPGRSADGKTEQQGLTFAEQISSDGVSVKVTLGAVGEFKTVADGDDAPCGRGSEPEGSSMVQRLDGREGYEAANGVCLEAWPDACGGIAAAAASGVCLESEPDGCSAQTEAKANAGVSQSCGIVHSPPLSRSICVDGVVTSLSAVCACACVPGVCCSCGVSSCASCGLGLAGEGTICGTCMEGQRRSSFRVEQVQ